MLLWIAEMGKLRSPDIALQGNPNNRGAQAQSEARSSAQVAAGSQAKQYSVKFAAVLKTPVSNAECHSPRLRVAFFFIVAECPCLNFNPCRSVACATRSPILIGCSRSNGMDSGRCCIPIKRASGSFRE